MYFVDKRDTYCGYTIMAWLGGQVYELTLPLPSLYAFSGILVAVLIVV